MSHKKQREADGIPTDVHFRNSKHATRMAKKEKKTEIKLLVDKKKHVGLSSDGENER